MEGLPPGVTADIDPNEVPEGFTSSDPSGLGAGGAGEGASKAKQAEAQRAAMLEQCVSFC